MKTKISTLIPILIILMLGSITAFAQGTKATFSKNGTTVFQTPISNIDSIVFKQGIETNYVEIDWDANTITKYDENTGEITVQSQSTTPVVGENSVIILPQEYGYDIRVIKSYSDSGKTLTVQTEQGNMTNLFRNISFTLSTDPSLDSVQTRAGTTVKAITPSEISIMTTSGYKKIYDRTTTLRAGYDSTYNIFNFNKDLSGTVLYKNSNNNGQQVYWKKGGFDIGLKGTFSFDFGETVADNIHWGKLNKFEFYLDGNLNMDLLLESIFKAQFMDSKDFTIKENIVPAVTFTFQVGNVPVFIIVHTDIYGHYDMNASAAITIDAGCNFQSKARVGLTYIPEANPKVSPIMSFSSSFAPYEPTFSAQGSLALKGSIYPRITFGIYSFIGPYVALMPYLRNDFEGGMTIGTDNNNYFAWTSKSYAGVDFQAGLDLDFAIFDENLWTSTYNLKDTLLYEMPKKISFVSPADTIISSGTPVKVGFYVSSLNYITGNYSPCSGAVVNFSTRGNVYRWTIESNASGLATIQWTPKDTNDKLTASIVDKDGKTISEATFTPSYGETCQSVDNPQGVVINGVRWATRNVDAPGTFTSSPCDRGMVYQWNRRTGWPVTGIVTGWDSSDPTGDTWARANDPSPAGWRIPTLAEIQKLLDTNNVTCELFQKNGLNGYNFIDKATGNILFLPLTGYSRSDGSNIPNGGGYWSSTMNKDSNDEFVISGWAWAFRLFLNGNGTSLSGNTYNILNTDKRPEANSIRPVAE